MKIAVDLYDSDTVLLTDNDILLKAAIMNYDKFRVPTSIVQAKKIKRRYNTAEKADLDIRTSVNKIGEIINLSQELNTQLWDRLNSGESFDDVKELYCEISKLDTLSNIEIDKAKKEYPVDSVKEVKRIRANYIQKDTSGKEIKPNFFAPISKSKGYYNPEKKSYVCHNTTMDYIQKSINAFRVNNIKNQFISFSDILEPTDFNINRVQYGQIERVTTLVRDTNARIAKIWQSTDDNYDNETKHYLTVSERNECAEYIGKINLDKNTMFWLLKSIEMDAYKDVSRLIFTTLFSVPNSAFYDLISNSAEKLQTLAEDKNGDTDIYGIIYSKS